MYFWYCTSYVVFMDWLKCNKKVACLSNLLQTLGLMQEPFVRKVATFTNLSCILTFSFLQRLERSRPDTQKKRKTDVECNLSCSVWPVGASLFSIKVGSIFIQLNVYKFGISCFLECCRIPVSMSIIENIYILRAVVGNMDWGWFV